MVRARHRLRGGRTKTFTVRTCSKVAVMSERRFGRGVSVCGPDEYEQMPRVDDRCQFARRVTRKTVTATRLSQFRLIHTFIEPWQTIAGFQGAKSGMEH